MLALCVVTSTAFAPMSSGVATPHAARAVAPMMAAERKLVAFDESVIFEAREVSNPRKPVNLLSAIEGTGVATFTAEAGLLSGAEEAGVFSTLEGLGAFSLIEKTLPTVESLGLLSAFEEALEIEAGLLFTFAGFLLSSFPVLVVLQVSCIPPRPFS